MKIMQKNTLTLAKEKSRSDIFRQIKNLCRADQDLDGKFQKTKATISAFKTPSFYEVSTRCNLFCEGCYYFEASEKLKSEDPDKSILDWSHFFQQEYKRKVSIGYFVGAETGLTQDRLLAAAPYFPYGNMGTNGTIRIHKDIPFRLVVSVWAANDTDDIRLRGASAFRKALKIHASDPRVLILYTVSAWNIDGISEIARMCSEAGLDLSFNFYSPTVTFLKKLGLGSANDDLYFRRSSMQDSPCLSDDDLSRAREVISQALDDFPETILYTHQFNDWVTQPGPIFEIDSNNLAENCHSRIRGRMRYYLTNLQQDERKCCTPDVDCRTCRMYSGAWSSRFTPTWNEVKDVESLTKWMANIEVLRKIVLYENPMYGSKSEYSV